MENVVRSRPGTWFAINVANPIDSRLLRWTRGRVGTYMGQPVGLLETTGARSGEPRTTPLLYLQDGERVVLVASKGGAPRHPAWYYNAMANREVVFMCRDGERRRYRVRTAAGEEREALWGRCNDLYAGYDDYALRTGGRVIPVVVLEPVGSAEAESGRE
jgi:deazaflavin-dependent oxidoreductase (nitroreductase family)